MNWLIIKAMKSKRAKCKITKCKQQASTGKVFLSIFGANLVFLCRLWHQRTKNQQSPYYIKGIWFQSDFLSRNRLA